MNEYLVCLEGEEDGNLTTAESYEEALENVMNLYTEDDLYELCMSVNGHPNGSVIFRIDKFIETEECDEEIESENFSIWIQTETMWELTY